MGGNTKVSNKNPILDIFNLQAPGQQLNGNAFSPQNRSGLQLDFLNSKNSPENAKKPKNDQKNKQDHPENKKAKDKKPNTSAANSGIEGGFFHNAMTVFDAFINPPHKTVQTAATTARNNGGIYSQGSTGEGVKAVQRLLKAAGYENMTITGNFGPVTNSNVRDFQKKNGLTQDGIVGPKTLAKLEVAAVKGTIETENRRKSEDIQQRLGIPNIPSFNVATILQPDQQPKTLQDLIRAGMPLSQKPGQDQSVATLQKALVKLGFEDLGVDGIFGPKTRQAVETVQRNCKLPANGIACPRTLNQVALLTNQGMKYRSA